MSETVQELESLITLAREPSSDKRRLLLRRFTDVFMQDPASHSDQQKHYFGDIMGKLAYDLESQVRQELAHRLAAEKTAPAELILRLANDEIDVARPVLQQSPVLTQDDLIDISSRKDQGHLQAITTRPDIGEALSDVLVERGDDTTVASLLRNETADIADRTMGQIADRATTSETLQARLVKRPRVPREIMMQVYAHVSDDLKSAITQNFSKVDKAKLDKVLNTMERELEGGAKSEAEDYVDRLARRGALTENQLLHLMHQQRPLEFLVAFAKFAEVETSTMSRVLDDATGKSLAIVCKASGLSPTTFRDIAMSPMTGIKTDAGGYRPLVNAYSRLAATDAQRVIRFWRMRQHVIEGDGPTPQPAVETQAKIA